MLLRIKTRDNLIVSLGNVVNGDNCTQDTIEEWVSSLSSLTEIKDEISSSSASNIISIASSILSRVLSSSSSSSSTPSLSWSDSMVESFL